LITFELIKHSNYWRFHVHIDQGESTRSIHSGRQDRVRVAHHSEMLGIAVIRVCSHQIPSWVAGWNRYRV